MKNKREKEYMENNKVSINEFQEMAKYSQDDTTVDTLDSWTKRNAQEIENTKMLDTEQFFLLLDDSARVEYSYPRATDDKGNLLDIDDTSKPKRLVFTFKSGKSDTYYKVYLRPQHLQALYMSLDIPSEKWDSVFQKVTLTRANGLLVDTNFRRFVSQNVENLLDGNYAFLCYQAMDKEGKPIVRKFTTYNEKSDTYYDTYIVIIDTGISFELVRL